MTLDQTTLYYLFSTIAQAVAAAVAIPAAFAVMRLSEISVRLEKELPQFARLCQYPEMFYALLAEGDFEGAIGQVDQESVASGDDNLIMGVCSWLERQRRRVVSALWRSLVIGGVVIAASIFALMFANFLVSSSLIAWVTASLGLGGVLACLASVGVLVARLSPGKPTRSRRKRRKRRNRKGRTAPSTSA